eukprot:CAMPEP_0170603906 /NCGR_PEP_ID=MMETSP0224-20130122/19151_1 /TAXON_ID=285029 /ORGANISM="Togula jolla, Strain CCCM 725" /LENGTH=490 /DNA_ID=CAMNT_0010928797 /DNA_START=53 /DNA_END=1525 /DNA_ORIENTATION=-
MASTASMAPSTDAILEALSSLGFELLLFALTLAFGVAFRSLSPRVFGGPTKRKAVVMAKGAKTAEKELPKAYPQEHTQRQRFRRDRDADRDARSPSEAPAWRKQSRPQKDASEAWKLIDEIVSAPRDRPGTASAAWALQAYSELKSGLREKELCLLTVAQSSKSSPLLLFSSLVQCAIRVGNFEQAESLVGDMAAEGVPRPLAFYESVMKLLAGQKQYHAALRIYQHLAKDGLQASAVTYSCLISFAAAVGELDLAISFFRKLSVLATPSIRAYMSILGVYSKQADWASSIEALRDMQSRGVVVDALSLNIVLATGVAADRVEEMAAILKEAEEATPPFRDVVSYNTLVKGYVRRADAANAMQLLKQMRQRGLSPNSITYNSVMDAAVRGLRSDLALQVLAEMRRFGLQPDKFSCSILVKGLARHGTPTYVRTSLSLLIELASKLDQKLLANLQNILIEAAARLKDKELMLLVSSQLQHLECSGSGGQAA